MRQQAFGRLREGAQRVAVSWPYILQLGITAGLAYWVSLRVFGHPQPFFAPMATIIVLSTQGGDRVRRSIELVLGVAVGVGLGDILIYYVGTGVWQIAVGVIVSVTAVMFIDKGVLAANQAAFASVLIATIFPPGTAGGPERMFDALIGGVIGVVMMGLIPKSPLKDGRREIAKILSTIAAVMEELVEALSARDGRQVSDVLERARSSQAAINTMIAAAHTGKEVVKTSPIMWKQRRELRSILRVLGPVDNAMRNTRVLVRRAGVLLDDHSTVSSRQLEILTELSEIMHELSEVFWQKSDAALSPEIPKLTVRLRKLAAQAHPDIADPATLSGIMIVGQTRSLIVDLLQVCGLSRQSAVAALVPTSDNPGMPPEVWGNGS
ncbi:FUSC family protein [Corynebacterium hindlerae]|uniref:FUSC family protein n=1 Tax=Corynebacterium hindlerae TaxID=699041 RepID=UPI0031B6EFB1